MSGARADAPSTAMRTSCLLAAGVFGLSAGVQWNDPDPAVWIAAYGAGGVISAWAAFGRFWPRTTGLFCAAIAIWCATLAPSLLGAPEAAFTSVRMQSASHEAPREAIGLAILAGWMGFLAWRGRRGGRVAAGG